MPSAEEVAERVVRDGVAPMAAAGWARGGGVNSSGGAPGAAGARATGGATETLFDLASVTKPMLAVAVAWAPQAPGGGELRKARLGDLLAEAAGTPSEDATIELLLSHRAGLDPHRSLYAPLVRGEPVVVTEALREAADARRSDAHGAPPPAGFPPLYSDLGYLLAGEALARAVGARDAGEAIVRIVLEPLGVADRAGTVRDLAARGVHGPFAPTETVSWRGGPVVGAVHDENAWAMSGHGGSGHAGIFATVGAVLTFGQAVLRRLEEGEELQWLVRERPGGTLRAGFDGKSDVGSSAGAHMHSTSFGHLGFTGTSLWIDPVARVIVSLLTNRVCPTRDHLAIRGARPMSHDALFEAATLSP